MPRTKRIKTPADALAQLHADPDSRPGLLDGLLVEGADLFAARRRASRERISGPDPVPPPPRKERRSMPTTAVKRTRPALEGEVLPAEGMHSHALPAHAHALAEDAEMVQVPGLRWEIISAAEFARLPGRRQRTGAALAPLLDALARGEAIRLQVTDAGRKYEAQRLRRAASFRRISLSIRTGPGYIAACSRDSQP